MLKDIGSKLPKVMAGTVNTLAGKVKEATIKEMRTKFKGGTSNWVLNSFDIKKATTSDPTAEVFYKRGRNFIEIQVDGGRRKPKGAESLLMAKGVLGAGQAYLPGKDAARDQYENLSPGIRNQVLSYLQAYTGRKARNNRQGASLRNGTQFFALQQGKGSLSAGVYQRIDEAKSTALRAQRAMIAKRIIQNQYKGKGGKIQRQELIKQLKAANKALLPRGINRVMAFSKIKSYTPSIKFYEIGNKIIADNQAEVFRKVANIEMGGRLQW